MYYLYFTFRVGIIVVAFVKFRQILFEELCERSVVFDELVERTLFRDSAVDEHHNRVDTT